MKCYQIAVGITLLILVSVGCSADKRRVAAEQQRSTAPTPSSRDPVSALVDQDWIARHQKEDHLWAGRTGLTSEQIRQLRLMADLPDDVAGYIDSFDADNLRAHGHILLVTASGNGHCLQLTVFDREGDDFKVVWSATGMPNGAGFCRESPVNPEAYATPDGKIVVKIPIFDYAKNTTKAIDFYTYTWNGRTYEFSGKSTSGS